MQLEKTMRNTRIWKWSKTRKKQIDNNEKIGVIFMNLSKAFDAINHNSPLAKLEKLDVYSKFIYVTYFREA